MAFIAEDGTGFTDSTSYNTIDFTDAYFTDRLNTTWASFTQSQKESYLIQATQYIDSVYYGNFVGDKKSDAQALEFPRYINGSLEYPLKLQYAVCELALKASDGALLEDKEKSVKREKVGAIEVEYDSYADQQKQYSLVYQLLRAYLIGSQNSKKVVRV